MAVGPSSTAEQEVAQRARELGMLRRAWAETYQRYRLSVKSEWTAKAMADADHEPAITEAKAHYEIALARLKET